MLDERPQGPNGAHDQPHRLPRKRSWMLLAGVVVLVAGHAVVLHYVKLHLGLSAAVVSGVIALVVIKHLGLLGPAYAVVRRRFRQFRQPT
jgi:uncharacterized membrane protein YhaH (DUF805 family)